jgi:hypothetical protein
MQIGVSSCHYAMELEKCSSEGRTQVQHRKHRLVVTLAAAASLLVLTAGSVSAARTATFDATFCFAPAEGVPDTEGYLPDRIVADVTWSGYAVDGVSIGSGDGQGAGFGYVDPLGSVMRSGTHELWIGADEGNVVAGADIRIHNHVLASEEISKPGSWSGLPAC